jgi:hypothetical protein
MIARHQRHLGRLQREACHELLEKIASGIVLGGLGAVDQVSGHHQRVEPRDALLPKVCSELRVEQFDLVFGREV